MTEKIMPRSLEIEGFTKFPIPDYLEGFCAKGFVQLRIYPTNDVKILSKLHKPLVSAI